MTKGTLCAERTLRFSVLFLFSTLDSRPSVGTRSGSLIGTEREVIYIISLALYFWTSLRPQQSQSPMGMVMGEIGECARTGAVDIRKLLKEMRREGRGDAKLS